MERGDGETGEYVRRKIQGRSESLGRPTAPLYVETSRGMIAFASGERAPFG